MLRQRKPNRLRGYDYSQEGAYFITVCTKNREWLFGNVVDAKMVLSEYGEIVEYTFDDLIHHNREVRLHTRCIMPNHLHAIIEIVGSGLEPFRNDKENDARYHFGIPEIMRQLKTFSSRRINEWRRGNGLEPFPAGRMWQKSYHDHIIRNESDYLRISEYIDNNPLHWELDCHNPKSEKCKDWSDKQ